MCDQSATEPEFFIGYRPTPTRLRRVLGLWTFVLFALMLLISALVATNMRDPGDGKWALNEQRKIQGTFISSPYPMLALSGEKPEEPEMLLLVNQGKIAAPTARELHGRRVCADGFILTRLGQRMLELANVEKPVRVIDNASSPIHFSQEIAPTETPQVFVGEIIDPKCFLGAMKPGDGKTHKACAALCLRGGIPPMFWQQTAGGTNELYLLTGPDLQPLAGATLEELIPFVADSVQIQAKPRKLGEMWVLELVPGSLQRR